MGYAFAGQALVHLFAALLIAAPAAIMCVAFSFGTTA
jgi:hypothetical protein